MRSLESILQNVARPLPAVSDARATMLAFRRDNGYLNNANLLSHDGNAKLLKGDRKIYGLTLLPHEASGVNVCPFATDGCAAACVLMTAGRGVMSNVRRAREVKTLFAAEHPAAFLALLLHEVGRIAARGDDAVIRLNVASDVRWEHVIPEAFELGVEFYDYTKWPVGWREPADNYRIVYSRNERDGDEPAVEYVRNGGTAAVVFDTLPDTWHGLPVVDGDLHDDRTAEPAGVFIGLSAKGTAKSDTSGFVVHT